MYLPAAFAETNLAKLHDFIERHAFGLLISQLGDEPFASHLPFLLERETGPKGCLAGHLARANPHWQTASDQSVLAVFSGPHAYVSPTWYEAEQVVPTWNYVAVHARGRIAWIHDPEELLPILRESVRVFERRMPRPWTFDESSIFIERLLPQIVGFRMKISQLEGKWKLNQNQPSERRNKVAARLRNSPDSTSRDVAALMDDMLDPTSTPLTNDQ